MRAMAACAVALLLGAAGPPPEPEGYRMDEYRSETPATLRGALVLTTDEARAHWDRRDAVFVDVLPQVPRPLGLPGSTIWRDKPREDVPGSVWLPDTGYGELPPVMQDYFERGLRLASGGDQNRLLVFYCLANCWMSWNAAKRAMSIGYTHVAWYPDGTDGWAAADLPLELRMPLARPRASE